MATAKAMLSDGMKRTACTTTSCTKGEQKDWVLAPNTTYRNTAGQIIGTTTPSGIFIFPLANPVAIEADEYFTGIAITPNWTASVNNCSGWTTNLQTRYGRVGLSSGINNAFLTVYDQFCNRNNVKLICAEQ